MNNKPTYTANQYLVTGLQALKSRKLATRIEMRNKLSDLNDHLFAQLERLGDESLKPEQLESEIQRTKAITDVSKSIVSNAAMQLNALKLKAEYGGLKSGEMPSNLIGSEAQK